jgi:hypothetical protein
MRAMRRALVLPVLAALALMVQAPAAAQDQTANYRGYAHPACPAPAVRLVALMGRVPEGVPASPPRPSIEIVFPDGVDKAVGQTITVAAKPAPGSAMVLSCPVVGDCAPADSGSVTIAKRADDGALTGEFQAAWSVGVPRKGRFTVAFRNTPAKCS